MSLYHGLKKPLLTKKDEEYQMLMEVAEECLHQEREKSALKKSGAAPVVVVREHLLRRGFNLTFNPNIKFAGSDIKNDLLLLHSTANPDQEEYAPNEVNMVIAVKNNAVPNQSNAIKADFDALKQLCSRFTFCSCGPLRKNRIPTRDNR